MMNREAFALYIKGMLELCSIEFYDECNAVAELPINKDYQDSVVQAVFATESSVIFIKDAGKVVGRISLKTTYDSKNDCQLVDITNYQVDGASVDMPVIDSTLNLELNELSQTDFGMYAEKLLAEYNISFEDYFSGEKKEYKRSADHTPLVNDVFHGDMVGIHISKEDYYIGHVCFVSDFKNTQTRPAGVAFDYTKVVNNTRECNHLLPDRI